MKEEISEDLSPASLGSALYHCVSWTDIPRKAGISARRELDRHLSQPYDPRTCRALSRPGTSAQVFSIAQLRPYEASRNKGKAGSAGFRKVPGIIKSLRSARSRQGTGFMIKTSEKFVFLFVVIVAVFFARMIYPNISGVPSLADADATQTADRTASRHTAANARAPADRDQRHIASPTATVRMRRHQLRSKREPHRATDLHERRIR